MGQSCLQRSIMWIICPWGSFYITVHAYVYSRFIGLVEANFEIKKLKKYRKVDEYSQRGLIQYTKLLYCKAETHSCAKCQMHHHIINAVNKFFTSKNRRNAKYKKIRLAFGIWHDCAVQPNYVLLVGSFKARQVLYFKNNPSYFLFVIYKLSGEYFTL